MVGLAREAARRGHHFAVFGHEPVHATVRRELDAVGAPWSTLDELVRRPLAGVRRLARDYDVLHLNLFAPRDPIPRIAYYAWPARIVFVDHFSDSAARSSQLKGAVRRLLDWFAAARITRFVGVSNYVRDRALARFGRRAGFAETIYGGVDVARFAPPGDGTRKGMRLASVANLIPEKGLDVLLRATAQLADGRLRVTIAGDGPEEASLKRLAADLGIADQVQFCGLRDDVDRLLLDSDVFVHPARWQEAFGLTVAEAMASECAVVGSRVGAVPELIVDGESGLLVPAGDVDALTTALRRLLDDPALRTELGRNARARVSQRFRIEESVEKHLDRCEAAAGWPSSATIDGPQTRSPEPAVTDGRR